MAAATVASSSTKIVGNGRQARAKLTAPADTNTWDTGLYNVETVEVTFSGGQAAADAVSVSVSGGVITFGVTGTARDLFVVANGN